MQRTKVIFCGLLGLVALLYAVIIYATPFAGDDWWFMEQIAESSVGDTIAWRFAMDNVRLANMFATLFLTIPRSFGATVLVAGMWAMIWLAIKVSGAGWRHPAALTVMLLAFMTVLPWHDMMFTIVFGFNYIIASALMLLAIWLFLRPEKTGMLLMFLLGLVCTAWHEAFGLTLFAGILAAMAVHRSIITRPRIALVSGLLLGVGYIYVTNTLGNRISNQGTPQEFSVLLSQAPGFCVIAAWSIMLILRRTRAIALSPLWLLIVTGIVVNVAAIALFQYTRVAFPGGLLAVIGVGALLKEINYPRRIKPAIYGLCVAVWCLILAHLSAVAVYAVKLHSEIGEAANILHSDECTDGTVYIDYTDPAHTSPLAVRTGYYRVTAFTSGTVHAAGALGCPEKIFYIIPRALKEFQAGEGRPIPGNAHARIFHGYIVLEERPAECIYFGANLWIDFGNGYKRFTTDIRPFKGCDGKTYLYAEPNPSLWQSIFHERPQSINFEAL